MPDGLHRTRNGFGPDIEICGWRDVNVPRRPFSVFECGHGSEVIEAPAVFSVGSDIADPLRKPEFEAVAA